MRSALALVAMCAALAGCGLMTPGHGEALAATKLRGGEHSDVCEDPIGELNRLRLGAVVQVTHRAHFPFNSGSERLGTVVLNTQSSVNPTE